MVEKKTDNNERGGNGNERIENKGKGEKEEQDQRGVDNKPEVGVGDRLNQLEPAAPLSSNSMDSTESETGEQKPGSEHAVADAEEDSEDWGEADATKEVKSQAYSPEKDQELHLVAMKFLGAISIVGILWGGLMVMLGNELPEFIGVVVGSAVTGIAALFSKK